MRLAPACGKRFGDFQPDLGVAVAFLLSCNLDIALSNVGRVSASATRRFTGSHNQKLNLQRRKESGKQNTRSAPWSG